MHEPLYLFYEEPDPDRWIQFDRYPRKMIRRIVRGKPPIGGVMRWFLNLQQGLNQLGVSYRINDYRGLKKTPGAWACVVGKPHVIEKISPNHPIVYGPGVAAHPYDNDFWKKADIRLMLLSCDWFKKMYDRDLFNSIPTSVWSAGIETNIWLPSTSTPAPRSLLVYDKIRWQRDDYEPALLRPILDILTAAGVEVHYIRYGSYREEDYRSLLQRMSGMIFLCEHETQGFAYLQALSSGVPILAWDRGGYWQDPSMFPQRVKFESVTSVPYFDHRCGEKFVDLPEFRGKLPLFLDHLCTGKYQPRSYITENFDLADRAQAYLNLLRTIQKNL